MHCFLLDGEMDGYTDKKCVTTTLRKVQGSLARMQVVKQTLQILYSD
jgi:hypothetical protein